MRYSVLGCARDAVKKSIGTLCTQHISRPQLNCSVFHSALVCFLMFSVCCLVTRMPLFKLLNGTLFGCSVVRSGFAMVFGMTGSGYEVCLPMAVRKPKVYAARMH